MTTRSVGRDARSASYAKKSQERSDEVIGQRISHFYIIRQLGSGGMGVVYEAQDTRLPRSVAIKFLKSSLSTDGGALKRFKREARLASSLNHPNICTIFDVDEGDSESFIAMELLRGCSLKDRLLGQALELDEIIDIATQAADGLAAAHDQGIIHRDIKPGNVFLTESGLVKLLDFGLAKHFPTQDSDTQSTDNLTAPGAVAGTLYYMAPEQLAQDASIDYRCDLFSFGVVLYEMVAGVRPFDASPRSALVSAIQHQPHIPLRQRAPNHAAELERIVDTLLAKRPDDRYQSAHALRADLEALSTTVAAGQRPTTRTWTKPPRAESPPPALRVALAERYAVGAEIGRGGMATVYAADDLRHRRRVALKVLDPRLGAMLGAERFLSEIQVTAGLQHPNLLPLFDSGEVDGLLYYVMPLVEGASLRARLDRESQLPVEDAVRIVSTIATALDYAHRKGVVHRDLKPENILLQDGQPLVADFGVALAVSNAGGAQLAASGTSPGTPRYMSPEQAVGDSSIDGRSDVYSLACVLYELLIGDPPFTGSSAQAVIAKVISDPPSSVRAVRPAIPAHVDAALTRALAKRPADRYASAREFADALLLTPITTTTRQRAAAGGWRRSPLLVLGATAAVALAGVAWMAARPHDSSAEFTVFSYPNIIDQTQFGSVTISPEGRALVFTGSAAAGRPLMLQRLDERTAHVIPGTERALDPFVSPDGKRLLFSSSERMKEIIAIDGVPASRGAAGWRYGSGGWMGDTAVVRGGGPDQALWKSSAGQNALTEITRRDTAQGETRHSAPLVLPGAHDLVFTVSKRSGPGPVSGALAIASLNPGPSLAPHVLLDVKARRAIAFVDAKWLLYASENGQNIMVVQLDVAHRRTVGAPFSVWKDSAGNLETASLADNGTLLYVRMPQTNSVVFVDSSGAERPGMPKIEGSFMNPRLSPDGKRFAVQVGSALGQDVWVYDIESPTPKRLTTSGKALQPTWTPDGRIVYMMAKSSGIVSQPLDGGPGDTIPGTDRAFAPTVSPTGELVAFHTRPANMGETGTIWSAPLKGIGARRPLADTGSTNNMPAFSPDGHWLAYVSTDATGRNEVYVRSFPILGPSVRVSDGNGTEPAWSPDGRRIYYRGNGSFMAATFDAATPAITSRRAQFKDASDNTMPHRNYDVLPNDKGFLMIAPTTTGGPEAVVMVNWLTKKLRAQLALHR